MEEIIRNIIKKELDELGYKPVTQKEHYTVEEAAEYLNYSTSYMYQLNSRNEITYSKPHGGKIIYFKEDLDNWIRKVKVKSNVENINCFNSNYDFNHKLH